MNQLQRCEQEVLKRRVEIYKGVNRGTHTLDQLNEVDEELRIARLALLDWEQDERVKQLDARGYIAKKDTLAVYGHVITCKLCGHKLENEHRIEQHEQNWHRSMSR